MHLAAKIWHDSVKKCSKSTNRSLEVNWIDCILHTYTHTFTSGMYVAVCVHRGPLITVRVPLIWGIPLSHWSVLYFDLFSISAHRCECARIRIAAICRPHKSPFACLCVCDWHSRWRQAYVSAPLQILNFSFVGKQCLLLTFYIYFLCVRYYEIIFISLFAVKY